MGMYTYVPEGGATFSGASRLVIAHRLSSVQHADRIVVLSGGKVVQCGRYGELAQQDGVFGQLVRPQIA